MRISKPTFMRVIGGPENFSPSHENSEIIGAFNSGATSIETPEGLETLLLLRVPEIFNGKDEGSIYVPRWDYKTTGSPLVFDPIPARAIIKQSEKEIKYSDTKGEIKTRLKHTSHLEIRILKEDGKLEKWGKGSILPKYDFEEFGIEDPRITKFDEEVERAIGYKYGITYVVPHDLHKISTVIRLTNDFETFDYLPLGNTPRPVKNGKDVALLPGRYLNPSTNILTKKRELEFAMNVRPSEHNEISPAGIALEYSSNLTEMGLPHRLIGNQNGITTGTGAPPERIGDKLIAPSHEAIPYSKKESKKWGHSHYYLTKLLEMDAKEPWKTSIIPGFNLERKDFEDILPGKGYVPNVVYTIGMIVNPQKDKLRMFHGICDTWEAETGHDIIY